MLRRFSTFSSAPHIFFGGYAPPTRVAGSDPAKSVNQKDWKSVFGIIAKLLPEAVILENMKDVVNEETWSDNELKKVLEDLEAAKYTTAYWLSNTMAYRSPVKRCRLTIVGLRGQDAASIRLNRIGVIALRIPHERSGCPGGICFSRVSVFVGEGV